MAKQKQNTKEEVVRASNKLILAEGTDHEYVKILKVPKGRQARKLMPKLLEFMGKLADKDLNFSETSMGQTVELISSFWDYDNFEEVLVPFALQMTSSEEQKLLEEEFTLIEIMEGFLQAAQYAVEASLDKPEVQEALKKSKPEASTKGEVAAVPE